MNIRIDSTFNSLAGLNLYVAQVERDAEATQSQQSSPATESDTRWQVRNENRAAASNPLQDSATAGKVAALIRNQIANTPATAIAAHQLSPRTVSNLLS